jgi:hypothetical protein
LGDAGHHFDAGHWTGGHFGDVHHFSPIHHDGHFGFVGFGFGYYGWSYPYYYNYPYYDYPPAYPLYYEVPVYPDTNSPPATVEPNPEATRQLASAATETRFPDVVMPRMELPSSQAPEALPELPEDSKK